jgi:hypothetical protein
MHLTIRPNSTSFRYLVRWDSEFNLYSSTKERREEYKYRQPRTFCEYYRKVLAIVAIQFSLGICAISLPFFLALYFTDANVDAMPWFAVLISGLGLILTCFCIVTPVVLGLFWIKDKFFSWKEAKRRAAYLAKHADGANYVEPTPGFMKTLYFGLKSKVCPIIVITDEA